MELIDRNALGIGRCNPEAMIDRAYAAGWNGVIGIIEKAAVVDAVPVVRCKDCSCEVSTEKMREVSGALWRKHKLQPYKLEDFCSYGEPRTP